MEHAKTKQVAGWLAAGLGLWLAAGTAWAQHLAPVNPAFAKWMKDGGKEAAAARRAAARARGDEGPSLGYVPEVADLSYLADLNDSMECGVSAGRPARYDLRDEGRVTPVRDQGTHPTCWAHAAMASLEPSAKASLGADPDWSEGHMAANHGWSASVEDGGNAMMASGYLLRWGGPVAETDGDSPAASPEAHVQRTRWVPGKVAALDNDRIKDAIVAHGPLYAGFWWSEGYYDPAHASFRAPAEALGRSPNHAVALVGWDDAYPRGNFRDPPPGDGAWLAKNSWGEDWGDGGFFWVSYWDATLGRNTMHAFTGVDAADNYDAVWEHDPLGFVGSVGGTGSTAWGANAFTAASATKIAAVGFWALAPRTSYHLWVYAGGTAGKPRSGRLLSDQSGNLDDAGYVTVPLETPAEVAAGERFTVVAKLTTPGYKYPLAVEYQVHGATDAANAAKGQSFLSLDGQTWSDFTEKVHATANFCLKAYAKSGETARTLADLAISGPGSIASGKSAAYVCEARYSDGSARPVDPAWSIAEGAAWAAVDAAGTVTAGEVDGTVRATLRADYEESGTSASAEWTFEVTAAAPSAPSGLVATEGTETSCVRLSWDATADAATYAVWRSPTAESRNAAYLGASSVPRYSDTTALPGADFTYFVKARNGTGTSPFSDGAAGWRALSAPAGVEAADGTDLDAVSVSWEASEGAAAYRVWRAPADAVDTGDSDAWTDLSGWIEERAFRDTTAESGVPYRYAVSAAVTPSGWRESAPSLWDEGRRAVPVTLSALEIDGPVTLESGATGDYRCTAVYTDGSRIPDVPAAWTADAGTLETAGDGSLARWTAPVVAANASVLLRAAWTDTAGTAAEGTREVAVTPVRPAAPASIETLAATVDGVTVGWTPSPGASGYVLWRGTDAADRGELAETADTAHADTGGEPGTTYRYWVAAANAAGASEPSAAFAEGTRLVAAPARVTATHGARAAAVTVSWVPGPGATHHRVWRADAPDAEKAALGDWVTATTWTDATAEPGTEYRYWGESAADADGKASGGLSAPVAGMRLAPREAVEVVVDGPGEVSAGTSAAYAATLVWNDGGREPIAPVWSAQGGSDWAEMDASGVLSVAAWAADGIVAVQADWSDGVTNLQGRVLVTVHGAAEASAEITDAILHARWPWNGWVDVDYTLATAPEGQTATISLSGWDLDHREALAARTLEGDGADGEPVSAGPHRLSWNLGADHPGFHAREFRVSMGATPWVPDAPRESTYLVIDISGGAAAASWPIQWLDQEPVGGFNTDEYKTGKLVLRRIEPGTFTMGSPSSEIGRWDIEDPHEVTLTKPYYIGLFPVTQRQWELVVGTRPSYFANDGCYAMRPVEMVSYDDIRGSVEGAGWPSHAEVDAGSFMGVVRAKTGLLFDLPTEAQWEHACRAETTTSFYNGQDITDATHCPNLDLLGRYGANGGSGGTPESDATTGTAIVGGYAPNVWGLYDMLGNVNEWCLDWYQEHLRESQTNPVGPATGTQRTAHGGAWDAQARYCRPAARGHAESSKRWSIYGFRMACSAEGKRPQVVTFASVGPQTPDARVELTATATSGGEVTFAVVSGPGVLNGNILTFKGTGRVVVSATQAGDDTWEAATAMQSILVLADAGGSAYLVVDMSGGPGAESWPVESLDAQPTGGFNTDEYKTGKLVLKKIGGGTFTMGSPGNELGRWDVEDQHEVTLTKPFYIGLFPVTQRQWELALGTRPSYFTNGTCYAMRPVENVSYEDIRGSTEGARWPIGDGVDDGSFMAVMRAKTGLPFDLPTDAQWEWSCRAGTTTPLYNGKELTGLTTCPNLAELGRYIGNNSSNRDRSVDASEGTAVVGGYLPNAWGLYDMLGNVDEWCLDWREDHLLSTATDPVGPVSGTWRIARGGAWDAQARFCRAAMRGGAPASQRWELYGFRLACQAEERRAQRVTFESVGPQTVDTQVELRATATSGGLVTFAVESGPGMLDGNILTFSGPGTVVVIGTQTGDETWEPATARLVVEVAAAAPEFGHLLHRWSFNGDFKDSVGGQTGAYVGSAACSWSADGKSVSLPGGAYGRSGVCLGQDVIPLDDSPFTIEIWGTQREVRRQGRIFDLTTAMGGSFAGNWFIMGWSHGTNVDGDEVCIWKPGPEGLQSTGTSIFYSAESLAPYTLGEEYHISAVVEPNKDGNGRTYLRIAKRNAVTGEILSQTSGYASDDWVPSMLAGAELWLGHSSFPNDLDAAADYNEVRIWNDALTDEQLMASVCLGPDGLSDESGETTPDTPPETLPEQLLHRWSFNGDFTDSVRGATGAYSGNSACAWRFDGKAVSLEGGDYGNSGVCLGKNVIPSDNSPFTIEIWGTQREVRRQGRLFDLTTAMGRSFAGNWFVMGWSHGTNADGDEVSIWKPGPDGRQSTGTSIFYSAESLAPYTLGEEYHISAVVEPNKDGNGRTYLRVAKRNAVTGEILSQTSGYANDDWVPSMLAGAELWLGHSSFPNDEDAAADYDEVRIWNSALTDEQLTDSAHIGPDILPEWSNQPASGDEQ